jgi:hypothetical protein
MASDNLFQLLLSCLDLMDLVVGGFQLATCSRSCPTSFLKEIYELRHSFLRLYGVLFSLLLCQAKYGYV